MSKYNEQHATTMLNALIGTETLKRYEEKIRKDAIEMQLRFAEEEAQERERVAFEMGKLDGAREFVEWLLHQDKVMYDTVSKDFYTCDGEHYIISTLSIDGIIAEWQEGIIEPEQERE